MTAIDSEKSELNKEALIQAFRNKLEGIKYDTK